MSQLLSALELDRRPLSVPHALALWIVEHLDVVKHVASRWLARPVGATPEPLVLEEVEEALGDGVVVAIAT